MSGGGLSNKWAPCLEGFKGKGKKNGILNWTCKETSKQCSLQSRSITRAILGARITVMLHFDADAFKDKLVVDHITVDILLYRSDQAMSDCEESLPVQEQMELEQVKLAHKTMQHKSLPSHGCHLLFEQDSPV